MSPQERALLVQFLDELASAQAGRKDPDAEALIREACARQPDAHYLLAQRALQVEQALQITQAELARMQRAAQQPPADTGGFLNNGNAWGRASSGASAATTPTGRPVSASAVSPPAAGPQAASAAPAPRFGSGMLGNVAATAAGVVAGSFLFQGVQNLLGRQDTNAPSNTAAADPARDGSQLISDPAGDGPTEDSYDTAGWDGGSDGGDVG